MDSTKKLYGVNCFVFFDAKEALFTFVIKSAHYSTAQNSKDKKAVIKY